MITYLKMQNIFVHNLFGCPLFCWVGSLSVTNVVEPVGRSEKKHDNTWNSGDRSEAKQEYGIKLAFGIESKY
jgi:hypothetical protein